MPLLATLMGKGQGGQGMLPSMPPPEPPATYSGPQEEEVQSDDSEEEDDGEKEKEKPKGKKHGGKDKEAKGLQSWIPGISASSSRAAKRNCMQCFCARDAAQQILVFFLLAGVLDS